MMRIAFFTLLIALASACAGWDSEKNLDRLDDQELEALCDQFYTDYGGMAKEEVCPDGVKAVLGERDVEVARCKAKVRPACKTQLLETCVTSLNGSLCADMGTPACRAYVDCELGN